MSLVTSAATKEKKGGHRLSQPLGRGALGGDGAEVVAGIQRAAGIMGEDIIQRVAAAERIFKFFASAERSHLAEVHDRHAVTMTLRRSEEHTSELQSLRH